MRQIEVDEALHTWIKSDPGDEFGDTKDEVRRAAFARFGKGEYENFCIALRHFNIPLERHGSKYVLRLQAKPE